MRITRQSDTTSAWLARAWPGVVCEHAACGQRQVVPVLHLMEAIPRRVIAKIADPRDHASHRASKWEEGFHSVSLVQTAGSQTSGFAHGNHGSLHAGVAAAGCFEAPIEAESPEEMRPKGKRTSRSEPTSHGLSLPTARGIQNSPPVDCFDSMSYRLGTRLDPGRADKPWCYLN